MRRWLLVVALLGLLVPPAAASVARHDAKARPKAPVVVTHASGEIKALSLRQITVAGISCKLGTRASSAARFVLTDPVAITCRSGQLTNIRYAPPPPPISVPSGTIPSIATPAKPATTGGVSAAVSSSIWITMGGTQFDGPIGSATGSITGLDARTITVGELTCPIAPTAYNTLASFKPDSLVSLTCGPGNGGRYTVTVAAKSASR